MLKSYLKQKLVIQKINGMKIKNAAGKDRNNEEENQYKDIISTGNEGGYYG